MHYIFIFVVEIFRASLNLVGALSLNKLCPRAVGGFAFREHFFFLVDADNLN